MIRTLTLGPGGPTVSALGLGCMAMSDAYGPADEAESIATIHAALDAGVTLFDTGDFYGMGDNEMLLGRALRGRRDRAVIAVKFGAQRAPDGSFVGFDARPQAVKNSLAYSLRRLRTDYVDLYQPARIDPAVPVEDTVGAIAELIAAGHVRHLGLSEASVASIRRAHAVHPVAALQIEYSLVTRTIERHILPAVRALGIPVVAYGVLSRGLLGGRMNPAAPPARNDGRRHFPRFQGDNLRRNLALAEALRKIAAERGATAAQLAIAWVLAQGPDIVPLVGARRRDQLGEAVGALDLVLSADERAQIERAVPADAAAGDRYAAGQMAMLDSERDGGAG